MLLDLIAAERAEKENWKINWVRIEVDEKNIFFSLKTSFDFSNARECLWKIEKLVSVWIVSLSD